MLTKDLLVTRRYRGRIYPRYADPTSPEHLRLAERVLEVFHSHLGRRREQLRRSLEGLEGLGESAAATAKLVRGLAQLIERWCLFEPAVPAALEGLEPAELRRRLCLKGLVTSPEEREARLREVARELDQEGFSASPEELSRAFWADREENQILRGFLVAQARDRGRDEPQEDRGSSIAIASELGGVFRTPEELLRQYNLSLTQTLLFDALEVWFEVWGHYQAIFRKIKRLGLMYEAVEELPGQIRVKVDGPASLLKETTKYGTALAKLLPTLVSAPKFRLQARIKARGTPAGGSSLSPSSSSSSSSKSRHLTFELDHTRRGLFPSPSEGDRVMAEDGAFDSEVERDFYLRIRRVMRGWAILREPTILKAGPCVFIPDFGFELELEGGSESGGEARGGIPRSGRVRYYLEIVGFWTPEYLKKKLAKLRAVDAPLLVAVDRALCCHGQMSPALVEELAKGGKEVFFYEGRLPLRPVVRKLLEVEEERRRQDEATLRELGLQGLTRALEAQMGSRRSERISLKELAPRLGVGVAALRGALAQAQARARAQVNPLTLAGERYRLVGEELVSEGLLARVRAELEALPPSASGGGEGDSDSEPGASSKRGWELERVLEVLERHGLGEAALEALGYRIERESLLSARVVASA